MNLRTQLRTFAVAGLAIGLAFGLASQAEAQKRVKWKMQSTWGSNVPLLGVTALHFVEDVNRMSAGRFELKFFEPGALVPPLECFDVISKGSVDACYTTPGYHTGKYPALSFFTTVPFGPQIGEFLAWKWFGGGNEMKAEIYAKHDLIAFDVLAHGAETSGWFREPITSLDQLKGMKMRFFGLGAQVMQKLGVSTQLLAGGDIYPALEKGVIDATEFSMPTMDISYGFYQIAKYNYFPGWHQQVSVSEILMNKTAFEALPERVQRAIEVAARANVSWVFAKSEFLNPDAMNEMQEKHGVKVMRWSDEDLAKFEQAWLDVLAEQSAKDPLFKKVADHYLAFRDKYRTWGRAQALKSTYLK